LMTEQKKRARLLAIFMSVVAGVFGWFNLSGGVAYAQYYCSLSCSASAPPDGAAGASIRFSGSARAHFLQGTPSYSWDFGDGTSGSGGNTTHTYAAAGTYTWSVTVMADDATASRSGSITVSSTTSANKVTGVSAASYDGSALSSEEIVAAFG